MAEGKRESGCGLGLFLIVLIAGIGLCSGPAPKPRERPEEAVASPAPPPPRSSGCVEKGVAYFREIGSYPRLSDGRDAVDVAVERCRRSPGAFD